MNMTTKMLLATLGLIGTMISGAEAACIGTDSLSTCYDSSGNSYTVQRFGNYTTMNGTNAYTGSSWSQDSVTMGDTTFHSGRAANGNSWNVELQRIGDSTFYSGRDSQGNYVNKVCNSYGCF